MANALWPPDKFRIKAVLRRHAGCTSRSANAEPGFVWGPRRARPEGHIYRVYCHGWHVCRFCRSKNRCKPRQGQPALAFGLRLASAPFWSRREHLPLFRGTLPLLPSQSLTAQFTAFYRAYFDVEPKRRAACFDVCSRVFQVKGIKAHSDSPVSCRLIDS
jgi:hypothetical protein